MSRNESDAILSITASDLEDLYDEIHGLRDKIDTEQRRYESCRKALHVALFMWALSCAVIAVLLIWR